MDTDRIQWSVFENNVANIRVQYKAGACFSISEVITYQVGPRSSEL